MESDAAVERCAQQAHVPLASVAMVTILLLLVQASSLIAYVFGFSVRQKNTFRSTLC